MRAPLLLLLAAGCGDPVVLSDITLDVDFGGASRSAFVAQTPSAYRVALQYATLTGEAPFELFRVDGPGEALVFAFDEAQPDARSLVAEDPIPEEAAFSGIDLGVVYLEMDLPFRFDADATEATRTVRIWFEPYGPFQRGDVTVLVPPTELWAFGPGNADSDPFFEGLDRADAYAMESWPDGRSTAEYGPFGDAAFWASVPFDPFHRETPLPPEIDDPTARVIVRVADTWHFTDQAEDGAYDWPTDYANDWHMDFPEIVAE